MSAPQTIHIDSDLLLRPITMDDAPTIFALTEANRAHLRRWLPWVDGTQRQQDTEQFLDMVLEQEAAGHGYQMGIVWRGELVGIIGMHSTLPAATESEIGYWLAEYATGAGVMTRACRALVSRIFADFPVEAVRIRCAAGNTASQAIPLRLGFVPVDYATAQERLLYAIDPDSNPLLLAYRMRREDWQG